MFPFGFPLCFPVVVLRCVTPGGWVQVLGPAFLLTRARALAEKRLGSKSSSQLLLGRSPRAKPFHYFSLFLQCFSSLFIVFSMFFISFHCFFQCFFTVFSKSSLFFQYFSSVFIVFSMFFQCFSSVCIVFSLFFQCFSTSNMYISIHITFSAVSRTHLSAYRAATGNGSPF